MTQEDKDLLLQDLCVRLPYGVIVNVKGFDYDYNDKLTQIYKGDGCSIQVTTNMPYDIEQVKPYLFPLSSMTEEQLKEMQEIIGNPNEACISVNTLGLELWLNPVGTDPTIWLDSVFEIQDWLNKNHFDYRNLIDKNLAIDATNLNIY